MVAYWDPLTMTVWTYVDTLILENRPVDNRGWLSKNIEMFAKEIVTFIGCQRPEA